VSIGPVRRTVTGRVVYNRKVHLFSYKDVNRIVRVVEARPEEIPDIIFTIQRAYEDLFLAGADAVALARGFARMPVQTPLEIALLMFGFFMGFIASFGESLVADLRTRGKVILSLFLAKIGGPFFETDVKVIDKETNDGGTD